MSTAITIAPGQTVEITITETGKPYSIDTNSAAYKFGTLGGKINDQTNARIGIYVICATAFIIGLIANSGMAVSNSVVFGVIVLFALQFTFMYCHAAYVQTAMNTLFAYRESQIASGQVIAKPIDDTEDVRHGAKSAIIITGIIMFIIGAIWANILSASTITMFVSVILTLLALKRVNRVSETVNHIMSTLSSPYTQIPQAGTKGTGVSININQAQPQVPLLPVGVAPPPSGQAGPPAGQAGPAGPVIQVP